MTTHQSSDTTDFNDNLLARVQAAYDSARYLDAHEISKPLGGLSEWEGPAARRLAGRLAANLGGHRLSSALHFTNYRRHPGDPDNLLFYVYSLRSRFGFWRAWLLLRRFGDAPAEPGPAAESLRRSNPKVCADWLAMRASVKAGFRDFTAAEADIEAALAIMPQRAWIFVERAGVYEAADRYDEAIEAARHALHLRPHFRPAVQVLAHLLILRSQMDEGIELLERETQTLQSGDLWWQLAGFYREQQAYRREDEAICKARDHWVLRDKTTDMAMAARLSDTAYHLDDWARSIEQGRQVKGLFFESVTASLEAAEKDPARDRRRRVLPIPFVRQHHATCAPATLSAIAHYFGRPADHLQVAEEICYDGTPWHSERLWAEQNGYVVREFKVTPDAAALLVENGLPFTLSTVEADNAHLQAVIGFDKARQTILLRDPYLPYLGEMLDTGLEERYGPTGPRGMALVPEEDAHRLTELELPDAEQYELYHRFHRALRGHDRASAADLADQLEASAPSHPLVQFTRMSLAAYDGDTPGELAAVETLLDRYPQNEHLMMRRYTLLNQLDQRGQVIEMLEPLAADPKKDGVFRERLAAALSEDGRQAARVRSMLRSLLRQRNSASLYHALAQSLWDDPQQRLLAIDAFRFAFTLADKNEVYANDHFVAQQHVRQVPQALEHLRQRAESLGGKSSGPVMTYQRALRRAGRHEAGLTVLEEGVRRRPEDPDLLQYVAIENALFNRSARARELLAAAEPFSRRASWLYAAAQVDTCDGRLAEALERWSALAEAEPLNVEAQSQTAELLSSLHGPEAGVKRLEAVCQRFAHHTGLHEVLYSRLRDADPPRARATLEHLIELNPVNAWAVRELALHLLTDGQIEEARRLARTAEALDPANIATLHLRAELAIQTGDHAAAQEAYRLAIARGADNPHAIYRLIEVCHDPAEALDAARFIADQFREQTLFGGGLPAFAEAAASTMPPDELLEILTTVHRHRPDLWAAWSVLVQQHCRMNQLDPASDLAAEATEQFPLVAMLWLNRAEVHHARLEPQACEDSLREALRIDPTNDQAVQRLTERLGAEARFEDALRFIEETLRRDPRNPVFHARHARLRWASQQDEEALRIAEAAFDLAPGLTQLWDAYRHWCEHLKQPDRPAATCRRLVERQPGDADLRLILARLLYQSQQAGERLETLEAAIRIAPRFNDAHDLRAFTLAELRRFDEARAACRPEVFGAAAPVNLLGRSAWVTAAEGKTPQAIEQMNEVVKASPNYYWGWEQLAHWAIAQQDTALHRQATQRMAELAPHDPEALAYAAHARVTEADRSGVPADDRAGLRNAARELYARAFQLDPTYAFAGSALFDLLLQDKLYDEAVAVHERLAPHLYPAALFGQQVKLHLSQGDRERALVAYEALLHTPDQDADVFGRATELLLTDPAAGAAKGKTRQRIAAAAMHPDSNPLAAAELIRWQVRFHKWRDAHKALDRLADRPEHWRWAACLFFDFAGETPRQHARARRFIKQNLSRLATRDGPLADQAWGKAGYAAVSAKDYVLATRVLRDWSEREHAEPWMLSNLLHGLCATSCYREAIVVGGAVLQLAPDDSYDAVLIWTALAHALDGRADDIEALLASVRADELHEYYRFLYGLSDAVRIALSGADRRADYREAAKALRRTLAKIPGWHRDKVLLGRVRRTRQVMTRHAGPLAKLRARVPLA